MSDRGSAVRVIEQLRKGIPPEYGVERYSVGYERLVDGVRKYHLDGVSERGIIRFVSGSWGAGKTHFFRLLRDIAFADGCLVSNVELNVTDAALDRFERVLSSIVRNIKMPGQDEASIQTGSNHFSSVIQGALWRLGAGQSSTDTLATFEVFARANERLMADKGIDVDFKKMIVHCWKTSLPDSGDAAMRELAREEAMQWFCGEGTLGTFRKKFGVNKVITRDNAKLMLQSVASFVRLIGYKGLLILFDEAEQAYSVMRKSQLRNAQNNLLSLVNGIENLAGLFLIYATTPDFYTDPKHGIVTYGALSGRIGRPGGSPPRALDTIWNLDAVDPSLPDYQAAARKIKSIYLEAYPATESSLPPDSAFDELVEQLHAKHPPLAAVRFWRVLVTGIVTALDDTVEGEVRAPERLYTDIMAKLRDE